MTTAISIDQLSYNYPLGQEIFKEASYTLPLGSFHVLLGKNGAGKSTLLKLLMGYHTPLGGDISVLGNPLDRDDYLFRQRISYISHSFLIPEDLRVMEFYDFNEAVFKDLSAERADYYLNLFGIDKGKKLFELSTGEKRKVYLSILLARDCELLLIDEMTAVLDPESRIKLIEELDKLKSERGTSILLATNIVEDVRDCVDQCLVIKDGNFVEYNSSEKSNE